MADFALFSEHDPETDHVFVPVDGVLTKDFKVTDVEATSQVFFHVVLATDNAEAWFTTSTVTSKNETRRAPAPLKERLMPRLNSTNEH